MFDDKVYFMWLQHAFGAGSEKPISIAKRFNNIADFYSGGRRLWATFSFINDTELSSLTNFTAEMAAVLVDCSEKFGQQVICYSDEIYPDKLRNINNPPAILFAKGEFPNFDDTLVISVVGSRKADLNAIKTTEYLCAELSKNGVIIVSGGADGIDAASHKGAMRGTSPTVAILACSQEYPYLMRNKMLRNKIVETGGCLITEYPESTGVQKGTFQVRNRIMAALCDGLLVVRAAVKGGTMITVKHATKQNKDIFAVPGDINDPLSEGTNKLIKDGAAPVTDVMDILDNYSIFKQSAKKEKPIDTVEQTKVNLKLSENAKLVYNYLSKEPVHVSFLYEKTGLRVSQILAIITELELRGYAKTYSGQRCSLK